MILDKIIARYTPIHFNFAVFTHTSYSPTWTWLNSVGLIPFPAQDYGIDASLVHGPPYEPATPISATPTFDYSGSEDSHKYTTALTYTVEIDGVDKQYWLAYPPIPGETVANGAAVFIQTAHPTSTAPYGLAPATPEPSPAWKMAAASSPSASPLHSAPPAPHRLLGVDWLETDEPGTARLVSTTPYGLAFVTPEPVPATISAATSQPEASLSSAASLAAEHLLGVDWLEVDDRHYEHDRRNNKLFFTLGTQSYSIIGAVVVIVLSTGLGAYKVLRFEFCESPSHQVIAILTPDRTFRVMRDEHGHYSVDAEHWGNEDKDFSNSGINESYFVRSDDGVPQRLVFRYVCIN
jgi:hypothetical protein